MSRYDVPFCRPLSDGSKSNYIQQKAYQMGRTLRIMPSRRRLLATCAGTAGFIFPGCLSESSDGPGTNSPNQTDSCSASDPPAPTDGAASSRTYPDRPDELTVESVRSFLESYESVYQYNAALRENPEKLGRTNDVTVYVRSVSVASEDNQFTAHVEGELQWEIIEPGTTTPETPTETPLPMGHGPFEASYVVQNSELRRGAVTVECW